MGDKCSHRWDLITRLSGASRKSYDFVTASLPSASPPSPWFPVGGASFSASLTPGLVMRLALHPGTWAEVTALGVQATALRGIRWIPPPALHPQGRCHRWSCSFLLGSEMRGETGGADPNPATAQRQVSPSLKATERFGLLITQHYYSKS